MESVKKAVTCALCTNVYKAESREPLVLPCGHTFCSVCLKNIDLNNGYTCPTCRQFHADLQMDQLTVCYSILHLSSNYEKPESSQYDTCVDHLDDLRYWCSDCKVSMCSICLYSGHTHGHNVQLARAYVQERKVSLENEINTLNKLIKDQQMQVKNKFNCFLQEISEILSYLVQNSTMLHDHVVDVTHLLEQVRISTSIKNLMRAEAKVTDFQSDLQKTLSKVCDIDNDNDSVDTNSTNMSVTENMNTNTQEKQQHNASEISEKMTHETIKSDRSGDLIEQRSDECNVTRNTAEIQKTHSDKCIPDSVPTNDTTGQNMKTALHVDNGDQKHNPTLPVFQFGSSLSDGPSFSFVTTTSQCGKTVPLSFGSPSPVVSEKQPCAVSAKRLKPFGEENSLNLFDQEASLNPLNHEKSGNSLTPLASPSTRAEKAMNQTVVAAKSQEQTNDADHKTNIVQHTRLEWRDQRLLMHSTAAPTDTSLSIQLPSEAFLELSVGGQRLGHVYVRLWCQLNQAQQFMALCLGTLGRTYLGTKAVKVINKNKENECIVFKYYYLSNQCPSNRPVLADLNLDKVEKKPIKKGMIMQFNRTEKESDSEEYKFEDTNRDNFITSSFMICTSDDSGLTLACPFGEVLSGLDVVKAAASHHTVSEVTITQCGLVLPNLVSQSPTLTIRQSPSSSRNAFRMKYKGRHRRGITVKK